MLEGNLANKTENANVRQQFIEALRGIFLLKVVMENIWVTGKSGGQLKLEMSVTECTARASTTVQYQYIGKRPINLFFMSLLGAARLISRW